MRRHRLHTVDQMSTLGFRVWRGVPGKMAHAHRHNDIEINFLERGAMHYLHGGRICSISEGMFGVIWGAIPHQLIKVDTPVLAHWVTLPLSWFLQWKLPESLTQSVLHGDLPVHRDPDGLDAPLFNRWEREIKRGSPEFTKIILLEVEARLRRMALEMPPPDENGKSASRAPRSGVSSGGFGKVEQMAHYIAGHYTQPLRVEDIAAHAQLHPNYAMSIFRRSFGVSLMDYLMQHRISHAQRLLATTDAKVLNIAMESGFGSLSRFYAAFTTVSGQSPKQYRKSMTETAALGS